MRFFVLLFFILSFLCVKAQSLQELFNNIEQKKDTLHEKFFFNLLAIKVYEYKDLEACEKFLSLHKINKYNLLIENIRDSLAYLYAKKDNNTYSLKKYLEAYPNSKFKTTIANKLDEVIFKEYKINYSEVSLNKFVNEQPNNEYVHIAYQQLWDIYNMNNKGFDAVDLYYKKYKNCTNKTAITKRHFTLYPYNHINDSLIEYARFYNITDLQDTINNQIKLNNIIALPKQDSVSKLWGFINEYGYWQIKPSYNNAHIFKEGLAIVEQKNKILVINKANNVLKEFNVEDILDFENGHTTIADSGLETIVNKLFEPVFNTKYTYARTTCFANKFIVANNNSPFKLINFDDVAVYTNYKNIDELKKKELFQCSNNLLQYVELLENKYYCENKVIQVIDNRFINFIINNKKRWFDIKNNTLL